MLQVMPQRRRFNVHEVTWPIWMLKTGMSQEADGKLMNKALLVGCGKGFKKQDQSRKGLGVKDHAVQRPGKTASSFCKQSKTDSTQVLP